MKLSAIIGALALGWACHSQAAAATYSFQTLNPLGGDQSRAVDINNAGTVVGSSYTESGTSHATTWINGQATGLGTLGGENSYGWAINASGMVAGSAQTASGHLHAVRWSGGQANDLGTLGGNQSEAFGINDLGVVVGRSHSSAQGELWHATSWTGGVARDLSSSSAQSSTALGINNAGTIVGASGGTTAYDGHATRWQDGSSTVFAYPPFERTSRAYAVNEQGVAAGYENVMAGTEAARWDAVGNKVVLAGVAGLGWFGGARDINALGHIVGGSYSPVGNRATVWIDGVAIDLNSWLDPSVAQAGWTLAGATAINDNNWIVGDAFNTTTQEWRGFLITPVPEPQTCALMLMGLCVVWTTASKRRRQDRIG